MKLVLFDLDGTILLTGGAGKVALNAVFARRFGVADAFDGVNPAGKTDTLIMREMVRRAGLSEALLDGDLAAIRDEYLENLRREMPASPSVLMPGAVELIRALDADDRVLLGLLTGNFEEGARIKLGKYDLNRYFAVGAYGSDDEDRNALVEIARGRASALTGTEIAGGRNVVIVGDTVRDIRCARANGAAMIGVATGGTSAKTLAREGADRVFADFSDWREAAAAIAAAG